MPPLSVAAPLNVPVKDRALPAIAAVDLRKEFRRRERVGRRWETTKSVALAPVNFRVERGECVAILGQNGSGKSTLVRLLSTLLIPDGGTASIFGHDLRTDARAVRRLVNRVSVEASFFHTLDGIRSSIIAGTGVAGLWHDLWPLMVIGAVSIPLGLWVFHQGEVPARLSPRMCMRPRSLPPCSNTPAVGGSTS